MYQREYNKWISVEPNTRECVNDNKYPKISIEVRAFNKSVVSVLL